MRLCQRAGRAGIALVPGFAIGEAVGFGQDTPAEQRATEYKAAEFPYFSFEELKQLSTDAPLQPAVEEKFVECIAGSDCFTGRSRPRTTRRLRWI